ncbi:NHL repeat-containing protein [bacterium]|nr:NHL repeat-containing protein [bacterium]
MRSFLLFIFLVSHLFSMKASIQDGLLNITWPEKYQGAILLDYYKGKHQFSAESSVHYLYQSNSIQISLKESHSLFLYDSINILFKSHQYKWQKEYKTYGLGRGKVQMPVSISSDEFDHLFLVDISSDSIYKYSRKFDFIKKFGSFNWDTNDSYDSDFSSIDEGNFDHPTSIAYGPRLGYIVTDSRNNRLVELDMDGNFKNEIATRQRMDEPNKVLVNNFKEILVLDSQNDRLLVLNSFGQFLFSIGGFGSDHQKLNEPSDFTLDLDSNIYILDQGNQSIKKYSRVGKFLTSIATDPDVSSIFCDGQGYLLLFHEKQAVKAYSQELIAFDQIFDLSKKTIHTISSTATSNRHLFSLNEKSSKIIEWIPKFSSESKRLSSH